MDSFIGASPSCSSSAVPPTLPPTRGTPTDEALEYGMRFFNFNMANSSGFGSVADLQGPGGRGRFLEVLREPLADGHACDIAFATLVETRLNMTDWVQEYLRQHRGLRLDAVLAQNARREGGNHTRSTFRMWMENLAASYNGNLKSMLAFRSGDFAEDKTASLFGRLTEAKVAGLPVPNPKKAFMGRSVITQYTSSHGKCLRICFVSAHFPIAKLAAAMEDCPPPYGDPLHGAKVALAHTLRKVLNKAARRRLTDEHTAIFVQGDLNSRTVLQQDETGVEQHHDVLREVLCDDTMQSIIQHGLNVVSGRWRELPAEAGELKVQDLPVTYKFHERPSIPKGGAPVAGALTLGDVAAAAGRCAAPPTPGDGGVRPSLTATSNDFYKRAMSNLGDERLDDWGVAFKKHDFRAFRFPACADRVIYWAPNCLADRMSWELPRGGYEVNPGQLGSDHRPVALEAVLRVAPSAVRSSPQLVEVARLLGGESPVASDIGGGKSRSNTIRSSFAEISVVDEEDDSASDREEA